MRIPGEANKISDNISMLLSFVVCTATAFTLPARWMTTGAGTRIMMADVGAASTAFYTDQVRRESYTLMPDVLSTKVADPDLRTLMLTLFDAFATVSAALRKELVVKAEEQRSVFGDVQLGVDVLADELLWEVCRTEGLVKTGSSEEEPDVREMHADGKYCLCWDPLDGSAIVDNNWAVGTIIGIWPAGTGIIGATGRDQVASMVANYGPRTTAFVTLDDGVYEFTLGVDGIEGWLCSRERVQISRQSRIFSPANLRTARHELPGYGELIDYWLYERYTLRFCGGLVPDICQQCKPRPRLGPYSLALWPRSTDSRMRLAAQSPRGRAS